MNKSTNLDLLMLADYSVTASDHAKKRMQQRCIKESWLALILEFGKHQYQKGKQTFTVSLDKNGIKKLKETFGGLVDINKLRNIYLIMTTDSVVVTCAYRYK